MLLLLELIYIHHYQPFGNVGFGSSSKNQKYLEEPLLPIFLLRKRIKMLHVVLYPRFSCFVPPGSSDLYVTGPYMFFGHLYSSWGYNVALPHCYFLWPQEIFLTYLTQETNFQWRCRFSTALFIVGPNTTNPVLVMTCSKLLRTPDIEYRWAISMSRLWSLPPNPPCLVRKWET